MLGFCSNSGPSFIFGATSLLFDKWYIPWILWGIQLFTAISVGILLPGRKTQTTVPFVRNRITLSEALFQSTRALANVCGWVILFRTGIEIVSSNFYHMIPDALTVTITGLLELTNGCIALHQIPEEGLRFVICCSLLSAGGLCVLMQTKTVTRELGITTYIKGKMLQTIISFFCASLLRMVLFPSEANHTFLNGITIASAIMFCLILFFLYRKKAVAFSEKFLYNRENAA